MACQFYHTECRTGLLLCRSCCALYDNVYPTHPAVAWTSDTRLRQTNPAVLCTLGEDIGTTQRWQHTAVAAGVGAAAAQMATRSA